MFHDFSDLPNRLAPYIVMTELNAPVPVAPGPFRLVGDAEGTLHSDLFFRWLPSAAIEFDGSYSVPHVDLNSGPWTLQSEGALKFSAPVFISQSTVGSTSSGVRGFVQGEFAVGEPSFDSLRFSLANFPDYIGAAVCFNRQGSHGFARVRLEASSDKGVCRIDEISEVAELRKRASRDAGFIISHVGEWLPASGRMTASDAQSVLHMLHFWFGFLRGSWAGPLFPEGVAANAVVWRQFAPWKLRESQELPTWLPERTPLDIADLFAGFYRRWSDPAWRGPLVSAISWFVEANSSRSALESKIVLAQVALDLLAWVHLVETQRLHSRGDFKRLSAAGRIRALLHHIGVSTKVPDYFTVVQTLQHGDAFDGPGVITKVRNSLVHATEENRAVVTTIDGPRLLECSQLALHYVELGLLAVCQHSGHYARRGWKGWKGEDEILVPWTG